MNKQPRLIDADKQSEWLEKAAFVWFGRYGEYGEGYCKALSDIKTAMESGEFAPDPIPLPTIKPGDKVRHSDLGEVTVQWLGERTATVVKHPDGTNYDVSLKDLEVSHD